MSTTKNKREQKKQLGQFLTPPDVATKILDKLTIDVDSVVLEPSFGNGSFIYAYISKLAQKGIDINDWAEKHLYGCELDESMFNEFKSAWKYGTLPDNFFLGDFFRYKMSSFSRQKYFSSVEGCFDLIIGNPPFGGTIDAAIQDELDSIFGLRNGQKIKKETYAFFIVKCLDLLKTGGKLVFICSDTLLSINTMAGLRRYLMDTCEVVVDRLPGEFDETKQPMVVLTLTKGGHGLAVFGEKKDVDIVNKTANSSWMINHECARYFSGDVLGNYMVATSGMTIGKNEYFLRKLQNNNIVEPYKIEIVQRKITLERELEKARLGKIGEAKIAKIKQMEKDGLTEKAVAVEKLVVPVKIKYPCTDYAPYNKATNQIIYSPTAWVIYWRNDGEAVYAYKKSGPWYLHGVGGKPFFKKEGLTWQLISSRLNMRYLPAGYILDSGAPCAFLREGVANDELYFIMGWCLTKSCNTILKTVINHTRNIQSKDFERLPYPVWVSQENKKAVIKNVKHMIDEAIKGKIYTYQSKEIQELEKYFSCADEDVKQGKSFKQCSFNF